MAVSILASLTTVLIECLGCALLFFVAWRLASFNMGVIFASTILMILAGYHLFEWFASHRAPDVKRANVRVGVLELLISILLLIGFVGFMESLKTVPRVVIGEEVLDLYTLKETEGDYDFYVSYEEDMYHYILEENGEPTRYMVPPEHTYITESDTSEGTLTKVTTRPDIPFILNNERFTDYDEIEYHFSVPDTYKNIPVDTVIKKYPFLNIFN